MITEKEMIIPALILLGNANNGLSTTELIKKY